MRRLRDGSLMIGALLALGGCEPVSTPAEPQPQTATQRFFSGNARPGEFLTLHSLPPIPANFED